MATMKAEARVLLLGSSLFTFSDSGAEGTLPALVSKELQVLAPETKWSGEGRLLLHSSDMLDRAMRMLGGEHPDAVIVDHSTFQFLHEAVVIRIGKRWPRLYPAASALLQAYKRLCGGNYEGGREVRGRLFTLSRQLALMVIGGDLEVTPEQALANSERLLDFLLTLEDVAVISRDPLKSWFEPQSKTSLTEQRLVYVRGGLRDYCQRRLIVRYDFQEELGRRGSSIRMHDDLIHYSLQTRQQEAAIIAPMVLAAVRG